VAQHKTATKTGGKGRANARSAKKSGASRQSRDGVVPPRDSASATTIDDEVIVDRRQNADRRGSQPSPGEPSSQAAPQLERRKKVNRRRQIDPTTCERDYTEDEVEFMNALDDYKRKSGRMFPTCSEVLEVVRGLGYLKVAATSAHGICAANASATSAKPMPADWDATAAASDSNDGFGSEPTGESDADF
jgi:hypothetical protein